jgi:hypothetical protein
MIIRLLNLVIHVCEFLLTIYISRVDSSVGMQQYVLFQYLWRPDSHQSRYWFYSIQIKYKHDQSLLYSCKIEIAASPAIQALKILLPLPTELQLRICGSWTGAYRLLILFYFESIGSPAQKLSPQLFNFLLNWCFLVPLFILWLYPLLRGLYFH